MSIYKSFSAVFASAIIFLAVLSLTIPASAAKVDYGDHDLAKAKVLDRTLLAIMESYYDPERIDTSEMFKSTLNLIEMQVAEVMVDFDEGSSRATLEINGKRVEVDMKRVRSPWGMSRALRRVFTFLAKNLDEEEHDFLRLEYSAADGLLKTLDPHSGVMMPELADELRMSTQGEFEGIGIKITTDRRPPCNGDLTVVEVFDGTPAKRAGVTRGDKIIEIEGDSTINITTSEAAERLRGTPGTKVKVRLRRTSGKEELVTVTRRKIAIESVEWKMLEDKVGYISLNGFQANSDTELKSALRALHAEGMKGLVLDLRGNPGGLLHTAVKIADLFVSSGTLVTTAGRGKHERDVESATSSGTESSYPLVVMVNRNSASAAELVAGAIRNHGRALLVGETSFGKGSVQTVMPLPGGGALRLTIAQYLTPGDISIQAIGVSPDLGLWPTVADEEHLRISKDSTRHSESDYDSHLVRPNSHERTDKDGALEAMTFVPAKTRKADLEMYQRCYVENPDRESFINRSEKEFSRQLVAETEGVTTSELILDARKILAERNTREEKSLAAALKKMGVVWSPGMSLDEEVEKKEDPGLTATASLVGEPTPGKKFKIKVTVKNGTNTKVERLRAKTKSDNPLLEDREFVFGQIKPGRSKSWSAVVELPPIVGRRLDPVDIEFFSASGKVPAPVSVEVAMPEQEEPVLAFSWHLEDLGNGNGFVEPGEKLKMRVSVENTGSGATFDVGANLSAKPGVNVSRGHFDVGKLRPGKSAKGVFELEVSKTYPREKLDLRIVFEEWVPADFPITRNLASQELEIPVFAKRPSPSSASGTVTVSQRGEAKLFQAPDGESQLVGTAKKGAVFTVVGRAKGYFKVQLAKETHAWIHENQTLPGGKGTAGYAPKVVHTPKIEIRGGLIRKTGQEDINVVGRVYSDIGLKDLIVVVTNGKRFRESDEKKVAYIPSKGKKEIEFNVKIPLKEGANTVVLIARDKEEHTVAENVFVRRVSP